MTHNIYLRFTAALVKNSEWQFKRAMVEGNQKVFRFVGCANMYITKFLKTHLFMGTLIILHTVLHGSLPVKMQIATFIGISRGSFSG